MGKYVVAPFLWKERISRIDTIVLTHPHPDHLQGLLFILENFNVSEVWTNGEVSDTPSYLAFRLIIEKRGIPLRVLSDRTPAMTVSDVAIRILNRSDKPSTLAAVRYPLPPEENEA